MVNDCKILTEKIVENANTVAKSVKAEADANAREVVNKAEEFAKKYVAESDVNAKENAINIIERAKTVANLDANKIQLKAKKQVLDEAFTLAKEEIGKLAQADYLKFIEKLIFDNAENGDEVIISEKDKARITAEFVKGIAEKKKLKLTLSKTMGDFEGGIILSNNGVDKNLTLDMQMREIREQIESEVLKILQM